MRRVLIVLLAGGLAGCSLIFSGDDLRSDAGPGMDASAMDAALDGAGPDARVPDARVPDARVPDARVPDTGVDGGSDAGPCVATPDSDGDGFDSIVCGGRDCNDGDGLVFPGATQTCSDVIVDCDLLPLGRKLVLSASTIDTFPSSLPPDRGFAAALTRWGAERESEQLALALPAASERGFEVSMGTVHGARGVRSLDGACITGATHAALAMGGAEYTARLTLARSTTASSGQVLMQAFDVGNSPAGSSVTPLGCIESPGSAVNVYGAAAVVSTAGVTTPAAFGEKVVSGPAEACLAWGGQQCSMGEVPGTAVRYGGSLGGMVLGFAEGVLYFRASVEMPQELVAPWGPPPSGRVAATSTGTSALIAAPSLLGTLAVASFECETGACHQPSSGSTPTITEFPGVLLASTEDPLLSLVSLDEASGEYLLAFRTPEGVSTALVSTTGTVSVTEATTLTALRLSDMELVAYDLAVLRSAEFDTLVFVVLAGPPDGGPTTLLRVSYQICARP